ncbi:hypothetical protein A2837_00860 [Candidatus Kaiserbacteria bacterium RIFCSPHIGHO2_01_FULL_46_22]|uniref:Uncharacterized protein n=1 Tax=Candidatus Kaiserbacteria bacterium RIFCSPHIGHO2_01_FULL_46_22 TaxID=1798475 RepID=A0A1F6BYA1_9BACT|nr:MAG: hypothetical protein A2837_00860 [Candidatus Kaiserbacteria bacterium RIFCSPHIGHO2_01_FULL_46_22]
MQEFFRKIYDFFETLPDRLYPFASEIEGRWVRGRRSYLHALNHAVLTYGPHRFGYKLTVYRATFHFLGAVLFIIFAALISQKLLGSEAALYVLLGAAIVALFLQEFHFHPKRYGQSRQKGVIDWLTWVIPMVVYISIHTL